MKRLLAALLCAVMMLPAAAFAEQQEGGVTALFGRGESLPWADTGTLALEGFPALTEQGFLPEGEPEFVTEDPAAGVWRYASQTLRVVIRRTESRTNGRKQRCLIAEIFLKEGEEGFRTVAHAPGHLLDNMDRYKEKQNVIAANNGLVFAMSTDFFIYRIARREQSGSGYPVGVTIRGGELLAEAPIREGASLYPPLDMLALFDGGDMRVYKANELTGQQLLDIGARDVLSFGPILVRDGELGSFDKVRGATPQPRAGIGMFAPGHYVCIIAEGRIRESKGLSCEEFAQLFRSLGCTLAFNLDGGNTSCMIFMGKQLNQLTNSGVYNNARPQHEVMGIGYTELLKGLAEEAKP